MEEMEKNQAAEAQEIHNAEVPEEVSEETSGQPAQTNDEVTAETEEIQETAETEAPKKKAVPFWQEILDIAETVLISVFVVLLLFSYVSRPVTVDGRSMNPTLIDGDKLLMYRILYEPKQGDIVVVNNHEGYVLDSDNKVVSSGYSLNEPIIKRVIAVAGQQIVVDETEGHVYVNGVALQEDYINDRTTTNDGAFVYPITIPKGYIFVMGDNRNKSTDSRSSAVGLVPVEDVLGRAYFRYYPFSEIGFLN